MGCHDLLQGIFPTQGSNLPMPPALVGGFFTTSATWESPILQRNYRKRRQVCVCLQTTVQNLHRAPWGRPNHHGHATPWLLPYHAMQRRLTWGCQGHGNSCRGHQHTHTHTHSHTHAHTHTHTRQPDLTARTHAARPPPAHAKATGAAAAAHLPHPRGCQNPRGKFGLFFFG